MSLTTKTDSLDLDVIRAEKKVNEAFSGSDTGFFEGFVGDYEDFGSWFTSGLTGLLFSQALPEDEQKDLYIKRNSVNFGLQKIRETLEAFKELNELRGLSPEEVERVKELQLREELIQRDLAFVYERQAGDLDEPIDTEGKSFNDRWGIDDNEAGVLEFLDTLAKNPKYAAGMFTAELIKDLPLSVAAYFGLAAKGTSGVSLYQKLYNSLNKIQPKALRGLTKVATPVVAGAGAGAGYEASYSLLNEGKINTAAVQAGTEFGAAFGILGSLGMFAKNFTGSKEIKPATQETPKQDAIGVEDPREPVDTDFPMGKKEPTVKDYMDEVLDEKDIATVKRFSKEILDSHESKLFPELTGDDYRIAPMPKGYKPGVAATTRREEDGSSTILWDEKQTKLTSDKVAKDIEALPINQVGRGTLAQVNPNHYKYLQDEDTYNLFQLAHEKAHVIQNKQGRTTDSFPAHPNDALFGNVKGRFLKESEAQLMAMTELDRVYKKYNLSSADKSAIAANRAIEEYKVGKELYPIDFDERRRGLRKGPEVNPHKEPNSQLVEFLDNNKAASLFGLTTAGYLAGGEQDAPYLAAAGAIAALGTPALYRKLTANNTKQAILNAKAQAALGAEGNAKWAKQLEIDAMTLGDDISKEFSNPNDGILFLDAVENNLSSVRGKGEELLGRWKAIMNTYADAGKELGLFSSPEKVKEYSAALLANYVPHIIKGKLNKDGTTRPLTSQEKEDLIVRNKERLAIKGTTGTAHKMPRQLLGTIEELKKQGYDVVDDPRQVLSIYSQSLSRALFGRKMLNEFKLIELSNDIEKPQPALFSNKEFDTFVKKGKISRDDAKLYVEFDHPSLKGYKVHTNVKNILDDYFEVEREGGLNDFSNGLLKLNNALKRVFIFGSLFHGQALFLSSVYSMGLTGAIKGLFGKGSLGRETSWADFKLGETEYIALAKEGVRDGLQIVNTRDRELVNPGKIEMDKLLDKLGGFGVAGKKAFGALDTITWEFLHDRFKLASYVRHKEILMRKGMDEANAGRQAAIFSNDAFGSLDWDGFATQLFEYAAKNPNTLRSKMASQAAAILPKNKRKWLNLALFAPDWTISNLRIIGRTFTTFPYKYTKGFLKAFHEGKTSAWKSKEGKELVQAWNMYAAYASRAGLYTSALWWTMTEMFSDKEPTGENLWNFWFGEDSGKLDLGGGESQVISKQIAEPIHFIQHPQHTLLNKMSILPKTMMEGFFNKRWFSMKKGFPMGPPIVDDDGTTHYGQWILGKFVPIVANPIITEDLSMEERLERVITGFFGFPQYGKPEDFEL